MCLTFNATVYYCSTVENGWVYRFPIGPIQVKLPIAPSQVDSWVIWVNKQICGSINLKFDLLFELMFESTNIDNRDPSIQCASMAKFTAFQLIGPLQVKLPIAPIKAKFQIAIAKK